MIHRKSVESEMTEKTRRIRCSNKTIIRGDYKRCNRWLATLKSGGELTIKCSKCGKLFSANVLEVLNDLRD